MHFQKIGGFGGISPKKGAKQDRIEAQLSHPGFQNRADQPIFESELPELGRRMPGKESHWLSRRLREQSRPQGLTRVGWFVRRYILQELSRACSQSKQDCGAHLLVDRDRLFRVNDYGVKSAVVKMDFIFVRAFVSDLMSC
jgi:hypothetical protein